MEAKVISNFFTKYRSFFVCIFILPASTVYNSYRYIRSRIMFYFMRSPDLHDNRVKKIQEQIRQFVKSTSLSEKSSVPSRQMCTSRPGWQTMSVHEGEYKKKMHKIDIKLFDILEVDTQRQVVKLEPRVTMGQLTRTLLPLGWTIPIVPELDDLTVGGLIMGFGIETSSFRYGLFQHICTSYEIILPDGRLVKATPEENSELFYGIPWSYGTLGFLVSAEIRIIPAHKFVHLTYTPTQSLDELTKMLRNLTDVQNQSLPTQYDFLEALLFKKDHGVVIMGRMTDSADKQKKINRLGRYWKPWYYKHVESNFLKNGGDEYVPLLDYYHRHTSGLFWEMQDILPIGNNPFFRYILGWLAHPKPSFLKLLQTDITRKQYVNLHVVQDMLVPIEVLEDTIVFFHREFNTYPLWICPARISASKPNILNGFIKPTSSCDMFIDVGIYGAPRVSGFIAKDSCRRAEAYVRQCSGFQALYADCYMTQEEFRQMFDHRLYDNLKDRYDPNRLLPDIYQKVACVNRYPQFPL